MDVSKLEGLCPCFGCGGVGVLCRLEEPEEGDHDEVNNVLIGGTIFWVPGVEDVPELSEDGSVDGVGAAWWIVVVGESFEERSVQGMKFS